MLSTFSSVLASAAAGAEAVPAGTATTGGSSFLPQATNITLDKASTQKTFFIMAVTPFRDWKKLAASLD